MTEERNDLPDSAFENLTSKERAAFTEGLEKLTPSLKSKIIEAIRTDPSARQMRYCKIITTHEKDGPWRS